ncbi:CHAT domain-containing protein [Methylobacterium oxalidis]|uniref:CHAT domain-containing protein n=1 Tax=Methylobacterium oxalidis TaxID=944322 RepID=UPI003315081C
MTRTTSLVAINVDRLASTGGFAQVQDSPVGASGLGSFQWPLPDEIARALDSWHAGVRSSPKDFGRQLHRHLLATEPERKVAEALRQARSDDRILLAFSSASPELHRLPFEVLFDGDRYLADGDRIPFRWVNDGSSEDAKSHGFRRFLVAVSCPSDYPQFDHDRVVAELRAAIGSDPEVTCEMVEHATRATLSQSLALSPAYDAVVVVAHGEVATQDKDGCVVLEDESGAPSRWSGEDIARELGVHRGCLVVLCSCGSAAVATANALGGVAQRLMDGGHVGSVIAMQRPVTVSSGLAFMQRLLGDLSAGRVDLFDAYGGASADLAAAADWERGTAALYTRLRGRFRDGGGVLTNVARPSDEELIRIATLLTANQRDSRFAFSLPRFKLGVPENEAGSSGAAEVHASYRYPGPTVSAHDLGAVEPLMQLVGRFLPSLEDLARKARIIADTATRRSFEEREYTHYILIGSRSHDFSRTQLPQYSRDFEFKFADNGPWSLIDHREDRIYEVPDPRSVAGLTPEASDYALIEKIVDPDNQRVLLIIAGMWDTSTRAAGRYFFEKRDGIIRRFGAGGFQIVLEIRQGTTDVRREVVSRKPQILSE